MESSPLISAGLPVAGYPKGLIIGTLAQILLMPLFAFALASMLVGIVLLPVTVGMVIRTRAPAVVHRAENAVSIFGGVVVALLVVGLMWGSRGQLLSLLQQAGPATILLNLSGIFLGLLAGRAGGLSQHHVDTGISVGPGSLTVGPKFVVVLRNPG